MKAVGQETPEKRSSNRKVQISLPEVVCFFLARQQDMLQLVLTVEAR